MNILTFLPHLSFFLLERRGRAKKIDASDPKTPNTIIPRKMLKFANFFHLPIKIRPHMAIGSTQPIFGPSMYEFSSKYLKYLRPIS